MSESRAPASPSVSVVIPTYQRRGLIGSVLQPLLDDPAADEILVVNDGGTDGTADLVAEMAARTDRLRLIDRPHGGRQQARRAGIEAAGGEVVLLIDDDVRAEPGLVSGHAAAHGEGLADVIEGYMPVQLPAHRAPGQSATFIYAREYEKHCRLVEDAPEATLLQLWGGNVSLRRDTALAVTAGEEFPASYGEDTHLGLLCHRLDCRGRFVRRLAAQHLHSRTRDQFVRDAYQRGMALVWLHHLHPELVPAPDPSRFTVDLPVPLRRLVEHDSRLGRKLVETGGSVAGRVHWYQGEEQAIKSLRRWAARLGVQAALSAVEERHESTGSRYATTEVG
jgi:glycosyltransferase involved in cell wall biosynthesis